MSNPQDPGQQPQQPYGGQPAYGQPGYDQSGYDPAYGADPGGYQGQYGPPGGQPPAGEPPQGGYGYPGGQPMQQPPTAKNPFAALFDFSFNHFITPMIVKVVYVVATILIGLWWLIMTIAMFSQSVLAGLGLLILGAVAAIIWLAFLRMTLEFYLAVVRMSEEVHHRIGDLTR